MSTTVNMNLQLPVPTVTLGPEWASKLNDALTLVDLHDHSSGKGVKVTPLGLNISSDLDIKGNNLLQLRSARFNNQAAVLSTAQDVRSIYVHDGDLYYNNGAGAPVQITDGGNTTSGPAGPSTAYSKFSSSGPSLTIAPSVIYSYVALDTSSNAITVTLPAANSVSAGRFFFFKDQAGNATTNNITINAAGADEIDGQASATIAVDFDAIQLISNGTDEWSIYRVGVADGAIIEAKLADASVATAKIQDSAVHTAKINNLAVTEDKLGASAVTTVKINDLAVTSDKLASNSVATAKIQDNAVSTAKILNSNVTSAKLATGNNERDWVGARYAAVPRGAIGSTEVFYFMGTSNFFPGSTTAGSNLRQVGSAFTALQEFRVLFSGTAVGDAPSGTWIFVGHHGIVRGGNTPVGLFKRIS
jgi:hypothetical protein